MADRDEHRPVAGAPEKAGRPAREPAVGRVITLAASVATIAAGVVAVLAFLWPPGSSGPTPGLAQGSSMPGPTQGSSAPVPRAFKVASPDLDGYCARLGQGRAELDDADHRWRCSSAPRAAVDLDAACQQTNRNQTAHASTASFYTGAIDCWSVTYSFGAPRFSDYCRQKGYAGAENTDSTAYGWRCTDVPGSIYVSSVCQWQLGNQETTAIFSDFNDEDSWRCWG